MAGKQRQQVPDDAAEFHAWLQLQPEDAVYYSHDSSRCPLAAWQGLLWIEKQARTVWVRRFMRGVDEPPAHRPVSRTEALAILHAAVPELAE